MPWCVQKCPYCDFNSHQQKTAIDEQAYIDRLLYDLEQELPKVWGRPLFSIFIGGGTPSLFSSESIDFLLARIRALLPFNSEMEITMEANPGTAEANKFKGYRQAGVNRLSLGVQSFNNRHLKLLGRIHDAQEAVEAFHMARAAGFEKINLDLMYALPEQSLPEALNDLKQAIALSPEHLSWYQLTLEPNTPFYQNPPSLPDDDSSIDIAEAGLKLLSQQDYQRYEVSAFSRHDRYPSLHNLNYWLFGDYLGIGAGAHQKITRCDEQTITRTSKLRHPKDYLDPQKKLVSQAQLISQHELPIEFMMNALRLKGGFDSKLFFQTTGLMLGALEKRLKLAEQKALLKREDDRIIPTDLGYQYLNELLELFMPEYFSLQQPQNQINIKSL